MAEIILCPPPDDTSARHHALFVREILPLWERQHQELYRRCLRLLGGHRADAEDALANATVMLLCNMSQLSSVHNLEGWFHRLVRNACMDIHRKRKRRKERAMDGDEDASIRQSKGIADDPEALFLQREATQAVSDLVRALPASLRVPLLLRIDDGMSYKEIAARLGLTEESLRKRVQAARQMLAPDLGRYVAAMPSASAPDIEQHASPAAEAQPAELEQMCPPPARALHPITVTEPDGPQRRVWLALDAPPLAYTPLRAARFARYVEKHPSGWKVRLELADMLLGAGKLAEAAAHYRGVLSRRGRAFRVRLRLALCLHMAGLADEAAAVLLRMSDEATAAPATQEHLRGLAQIAHGQHDAAASSLARAAALDPSDGVHEATLGALRWSQGRPAEALDSLHRALATPAEDIQSLVLGHDAALLLGQIREARALLARAQQTDAESPAVLVRDLAHRCRSGQLGPETEASVLGFLRSFPALAEAHAARARLHRACGRWDEALGVMQAFVAAHPQDALGWIALAREARAVGDPAQAAAAAHRALSLDPASAGNCAAALGLLGGAKTEASSALIDEAVERFEDHWWVLTSAASALAGWSRARERAISLAERACGRASGIARSWFVHGRALALAGRWPEASASFERGLALLPADDGHLQSAPALLWLGEIVRATGGEVRAHALWTRALSAARLAAPWDVARALHWQGRAQEGLGEPSAARASYRAAIAHHLAHPARARAEAALALACKP
ncbi:sigma-70 family RNA polymerase sigma factor [Polyangium aurulentum]|uniref:sigma-70 family RNA polymerase sigma factor n=1 Tax=Polyangium aurulentum TaxID=2567896 RepID=UPI0010AEC8E9|nr:sigma-70 family RNA polymerase sigma factor [Polyangium aurulentum]UQA55477.1 sigma-70 family RNA polymerase sigma factor [Polyangium aurulentum]